MSTPNPDVELRLIDCTEAEHASAILEILNEAIVNSTALYDYQPRQPQAMVSWFATKRTNGFPVVGAVDAAGALVGFASWGTFRAFPAYKYTVEHSVYVHHGHRGRGIGRLLIEELIRRGRSQHGEHRLAPAIGLQSHRHLQPGWLQVRKVAGRCVLSADARIAGEPRGRLTGPITSSAVLIPSAQAPATMGAGLRWAARQESTLVTTNAKAAISNEVGNLRSQRKP